MLSGRHWLLFIIPLLLLTACGVPSRNLAAEAQAAAPPTVAQPGAAAATQNASPTDFTTGVLPETSPDTCSITRPPAHPFTPPPPYPPSAPGALFWYGDDALWTAVPHTGVWADLPHNPEGYTQKVFWWRKGYSWTAEPQPALVVSGRRLDASAPPLNVSRATNAFAEDIQSAMLVGVDFPTPGCWEITGQYAGAELSFVVWVAP